jgi:hypothetical protein
MCLRTLRGRLRLQFDPLFGEFGGMFMHKTGHNFLKIDAILAGAGASDARIFQDEFGDVQGVRGALLRLFQNRIQSLFILVNRLHGLNDLIAAILRNGRGQPVKDIAACVRDLRAAHESCMSEPHRIAVLPEGPQTVPYLK